MAEKIPDEILIAIFEKTMDGPGRGRGRGITSLGIALSCRRFNRLQGDVLARIPTKQKTGAQGVQEVDLIPMPKPALLVREYIIWTSIDEAYNCVAANKDYPDFWRSIRLIQLNWQDTSVNGQQWTATSGIQRYPKAHWVFLWLSEVLQHLYHHGGHNVHAILITPMDWCSLTSIDTAGMFGLSRIPALPVLRFFSPRPHSSINNYVSLEVRKVLVKRTRRKRLVAWAPTGIERPCPRVDWRVQAMRRQKANESVNACLERFLMWRYAIMFRVD